MLEEEDMRKIDELDTGKFSTLPVDNGEKTIAILGDRRWLYYLIGDRWWPPKVKQELVKASNLFLCKIWEKSAERPNVGGVSIRSRNGASSRKGFVVND